MYVGAALALVGTACAENCLVYWLNDRTALTDVCTACSALDITYAALLFGLWGTLHMVLAMDVCGSTGVATLLRVRRSWHDIGQMQDTKTPPNVRFEPHRGFV